MTSAAISLPTDRYPWQTWAVDPHIAHRIALSTPCGDFTWWQLARNVCRMADFLTVQIAQTEIGQAETVQTESKQAENGQTPHEQRQQSAVAFCGKNSLYALLVYLAAIQCRRPILMINPAFSAEKWAEIDRTYRLARVFSEADFTDFSLIFDENPLSFAEDNLNETADFQCPATLTLTSGSTGLSKAVVHHLHAHLANADGVCRLLNFTAADTWLLSLPLYHVSGQGIVWRWLSRGAVLRLPSEDFYADVLQTSHASLVPTQLQRLLTYLAEHKPTNFALRHVLLGGSHIPIMLTDEAATFGVHTYCGYGMTEMASTVFAKPSDGKAGVGQPLAGRAYCLQHGEIWLKGAGMALGYLQPSGKIEPLTNPQGWLQTKDKGAWQNGELVILGRLDNQFISGGENIQPEEIEALLLRSALLKQAVVLPVADAQFGQRPVAMVEFHEPFSQSAVENLRVFLYDKIERFKQPVAYYPLPLQTDGSVKISRRALATWLADQTTASA